MKPIYKIVVNENDDITGVEFNSFVDVPAHKKQFIAFGEKGVKYHFNDEKRIVTGVMISANTPIPRAPRGNTPEHYVMFDAQTIEVIRKKFHKNGFNNNLNLNHDANEIVKGVFMIESYIVGNDKKQPKAPEVFASQNLESGTWIASYYVEDESTWQKIKAGDFYGFSVEGIFDTKQVKFKMTNKMSEKKKGLFSFIFGEEAPEQKTFAEATTTDGVIVFYEGELAEGTAVTVEVDGEKIPAPAGDHQVMISETESVVITLDDAGVITAVTAVEAVEEEMVSQEEFKAFMSEYHSKVDEQFSGLKSELEKRDEKIASLEASLETALKGDKFSAKPLKTGEKKTATYKDLLKGFNN
jgi:hypothetical protein